MQKLNSKRFKSVGTKYSQISKISADVFIKHDNLSLKTALPTLAFFPWKYFFY